MSWLRGAWAELVGLFVDDGLFAGAIVAWLAAAWAMARFALGPAEWRGPILFAGLAAILVESALRRARK